METFAHGRTRFGLLEDAAFDVAASRRLAALGRGSVRAWTRQLRQHWVRPRAFLGETLDAVRRAVVGGRATW